MSKGRALASALADQYPRRPNRKAAHQQERTWKRVQGRQSWGWEGRQRGVVALDSMSESNKKELDVIQMQGLVIASGAICGTANSAIQVDMGEPPLQLRRL